MLMIQVSDYRIDGNFVDGVAWCRVDRIYYYVHNREAVSNREPVVKIFYGLRGMVRICFCFLRVEAGTLVV